MNNVQSKEDLILNLLREVLNNDQISNEDNFFNAGGDSKKAMLFLSKLRQNHFNVALGDFLSCRTIQELMDYVEYKDVEYNQLIDKLANGIRLYENFKPYDDETKPSITGEKEYTSVLITGTTGYLGSHLALQVLKQTNSNICLLVRGKNISECEERIKGVWEKYHGSEVFEKYSGRIEVIEGDISVKRFGLKAEEYNRLAEKVDCIIHAAAVVSHVEKWSKYETVNIQGTENVMKFATYVKLKDVNYISTIATEITTNRLETMEYFSERSDISNEDSEILYVRSKLMCENLINTYKKRGCNVKIFRMGFLIQDSETGIFQKNAEENGFFQVLSILNKIKKFPNVTEKIIDLTYVNQAADAVIKLFTQIDDINIYHIFNPYRVSISELGNGFKKIDDQIEILDVEEFKIFLQENSNRYWEYLEKLLLILMLDTHINLAIFGSSRNHLTVNMLEKLEFQWSVLDMKTIEDMYKIMEAQNE